jgi:hypothetical protein
MLSPPNYPPPPLPVFSRARVQLPIPNYPPPPLPVFSRPRVQLPIPNYPPPPLPFFRAKARIPDEDYWWDALSDPRLSLFKHSLIPKMTNLYWYKRLNDMYKAFTRREGAERTLPYDETQDYKKVADFIREELAILNTVNLSSGTRIALLVDFIYWGTDYIRFPTLQSIASEVWLYINAFLEQDDVEDNFYYNAISFRPIYGDPAYNPFLLPVPSRYHNQTISANIMKIYYVPGTSTLERDTDINRFVGSTLNFQGNIILLVETARQAMNASLPFITPGAIMARLIDDELIVIVLLIQAESLS